MSNVRYLEYSEAQYKKLLRKIDAYLIPMMFVLFPFYCYRAAH
jgi:hypothetical protein